jgi:hypothetical protein
MSIVTTVWDMTTGKVDTQRVNTTYALKKVKGHCTILELYLGHCFST